MITLIEDLDTPLVDENPTHKPDTRIKKDNTLIITITLLCVGLLIMAIIAYFKNKDTE